MLGALFRMVFTLVLAAAVLWFVLPVAASALAGAAVAAAGLHGQGIAVSVTADPPLKLLLLEADAVHIRAHESTWRGFAFAVLDLTVGGWRGGIATRSLDGAMLEGRLEGVDIPDGSGGTVRAATILVSGPAANADLTVDLTRDDIQAAVRRALSSGEQGDVAAITLAPPDAVRIGTAAGELLARLQVAPDGSLGLVLGAPRVAPRAFTILQPGPELPIHFGAVAVSADAVELRGAVDARAFGL